MENNTETLEDRINETSIEKKTEGNIVRRFGQRLGHYAVYPIKSILSTFVDSFRIPTAIRKSQQCTEKKRFLEDVIDLSTKFSVGCAQMTLCFSSPYYLPVLFGSNFVSALHERKKYPDVIEQKPTPSDEDFIKYKEGKMSIGEVYKNLGKRALRKTGVFLTSYVLTGVLAFGHLIGANLLEKADPDHIEAKVEECVLETGKQRLEFDLMGEFHGHNISTYTALRGLVEERQYDVLLNEGADPKKKPKQKSANNDESILPAFLLAPYILGSGTSLRYFDQWYEGLPMEFMEEYNEEGVRPGRKGLNLIAKVGGIIAIPIVPYLYWGAVPNRFFKKEAWFTKPMEVVSEKTGKVSITDISMAENQFEYMTANPDKKMIARYGFAHIHGLKKEFEKRGQLSCEEIDIRRFVVE